MKNLHRHLMLATALATGLAVAIPLATDPVRAQESSTVKTNPGFDAGSGRINPGVPHQAPSSSTDFRKIPTTAEARAALLASDDPNPVLGQDLKPAITSAAGGDKPSTASGNSDPATATGGQATIGGPLSPGASAGGANTSSPGGASETMGAGPTSASKNVRPGPIGAVGQTMPSKFSERNDVLDRVPIMAWPNRLTEEERQRIYQAVMADKTQPVASADALTTASELSTDQALAGMHALPESLRGIALLNGLQYVKANNKVFLVTPATRTVVDEIAS